MDFAAGGLQADRHKTVAAHLAKCDACRVEISRLQVAAGVPDAENPAAASLEALLRNIRAWDTESRRTGRGIDEIKDRVVREITPFLGSSAAGLILNQVSVGGEDLLSRIELVLALFLGGRAAGELTGRIVDTAIVRL